MAQSGPKLRVRLASVALRAVQSLAAKAANRSRRGARPWAEHTVSDLLVAHRLASILGDGERVLDVGCGSGHWLARLQLFRDIDAVGVDLAPPVARPGIALEAYDGFRLPFPDHSFDVTMFCYVLHHLGREHAQALLAEARPVTRRRIVLLEDSMAEFDFWYRVRNRCHRLETEMVYATESDSYTGPDGDAMFLTHAEWRRTLEEVPGVSAVSVQTLADLHNYAHHTLLVAALT